MAMQIDGGRRAKEVHSGGGREGEGGGGGRRIKRIRLYMREERRGRVGGGVGGLCLRGG